MAPPPRALIYQMDLWSLEPPHAYTHGLKHTIQCHTCSQQSRKKNIQRPLAYHRALFLMGPCRQARGMCTWVWRFEPDKCHAQQKKPGKKLKNLNVSKAEGWRRNCGQKMRGENRAKRAKGNTPGLRQQVRYQDVVKLQTFTYDVTRMHVGQSSQNLHAKTWQGMSPLYKRCSHQLHQDAGTTTESPHIVLVQYVFAWISLALLQSLHCNIKAAKTSKIIDAEAALAKLDSQHRFWARQSQSHVEGPCCLKGCLAASSSRSLHSNGKGPWSMRSRGQNTFPAQQAGNKWQRQCCYCKRFHAPLAAPRWRCLGAKGRFGQTLWWWRWSFIKRLTFKRAFSFSHVSFSSRSAINSTSILSMKRGSTSYPWGMWHARLTPAWWMCNSSCPSCEKSGHAPWSFFRRNPPPFVEIHGKP